MFDWLLEVGVGENEASSAVLVDVVIGPDCFFDSLFFVEKSLDILVL